MDAKISTVSVCPYCKHTNLTEKRVTITGRFWPHRFVVVCNDEEGGCGYPYYVETKVIIETTVLSIEGMQAEYLAKGSK